MLTKPQYIAQLYSLKDWYRKDNAWIERWDDKWSDEAVMNRFINAAYNLYCATARNSLQLTVLGGTEIRMDSTYVQNFGVTAANGIQDKATEIIVKKETLNRHFRARNAVAGPNSSSPDNVPAPVKGSGSILSEKDWTPILNDSLVLGAIEGRQSFYLGLTESEQLHWAILNGDKVNRTQTIATRFGETDALKKAWISFFNSQKQMFFQKFGPRVFTRELLGLCFFGYKPEFSWHQLAFYPVAGAGETANFDNYVKNLREVHFHSYSGPSGSEPTDQAKIMKVISKFLFNDETALGAPWPSDTNIGPV
jgi:hypothetical protein